MNNLHIRRATTSDAEDAVGVLRESITELCVVDHQNDPATLTAWLRNKTPEKFVQWLSADDTYIIVAECDAVICGVGSINRAGEVGLCYVRPGMQGRGVGKAMLTRLEFQAREWEIKDVKLNSTAAARNFYEHQEYVVAGAARLAFNSRLSYPYQKRMT